MDLDKLHMIVKKLDLILDDRQEGVATWWIALSNLIESLFAEIKNWKES